MKYQALVLSLATLAIASLTGLAAEKMDETKLQKSMKEVGDAAKRFKKNQDEKNADQMAKDAQRIAEIYHETIAFWKERKMDDAVKSSQESEAAAKAAAIAAKAGDWEKVKANVQGLMKNCKSCHDSHREKLEDGTYRLK
jgi:cytochrome c556